MLKVNSSRAMKILESPRFYKREVTSDMRKFPGSGIALWVGLEGSADSVKNLSFSGTLEAHHVLVLESMASLLMGKKISSLEGLTLRECEAYLRDRNSEMSFEGITPDSENLFREIFHWIRNWPFQGRMESYAFSPEKGPFRRLPLADKVRELKAFLSSAEVAALYRGHRTPELIDVEELTVYLEVPYGTDAERALLHELHERGTEVFREDELNFIPEL